MTESLEARDTRDAPPPVERWEPPTLWGLLMRHKRASAAVIGVLVLLIAIVVVGDLNSRLTRITDSTPCSGWSSANLTERAAYAALYTREHGALPSVARASRTVDTAVEYGCDMAYGYDEADTVTVLQAIRHQY